MGKRSGGRRKRGQLGELNVAASHSEVKVPGLETPVTVPAPLRRMDSGFMPGAPRSPSPDEATISPGAAVQAAQSQIAKAQALTPLPAGRGGSTIVHASSELVTMRVAHGSPDIVVDDSDDSDSELTRPRRGHHASRSKRGGDTAAASADAASSSSSSSSSDDDEAAAGGTIKRKTSATKRPEKFASMADAWASSSTLFGSSNSVPLADSGAAALPSAGVVTPSAAAAHRSTLHTPGLGAARPSLTGGGRPLNRAAGRARGRWFDAAGFEAVATHVMSAENVFRLVAPDPVEVAETQSLVSALPRLRKWVSMIKSGVHVSSYGRAVVCCCGLLLWFAAVVASATNPYCVRCATDEEMTHRVLVEVAMFATEEVVTSTPETNNGLFGPPSVPRQRALLEQNVVRSCPSRTRTHTCIDTHAITQLTTTSPTSLSHSSQCWQR